MFWLWIFLRTLALRLVPIAGHDGYTLPPVDHRAAISLSDLKL